MDDSYIERLREALEQEEAAKKSCAAMARRSYRWWVIKEVILPKLKYVIMALACLFLLWVWSDVLFILIKPNN